QGPDAADWLQGLLTQDVKALADGQGAYAAYLTPQGRMVADLRVFRRTGMEFLAETAAAARSDLLSRLDQFIIMEDVTVSDVSSAIDTVTVVGPGAVAVVAAVTGLTAAALEGLPEHAQLAAGVDGGFVAASREFGESGFDLVAPVAHAASWREALAARVPQAGDRLIETARIEVGRPRFGVDMHEDTIPLEAGIESRAINHDKGCYVGQEIVIRILHRGQGRVARRLVWLESATAGTDAWPAGTGVTLGEKAVGTVTSACWSPARQRALAIAMLHRDATEPGTTVRVDTTDALVARLP
ncbi:MAG TPA: glycine cleavage T C-terminal barrel domain-containing protein, partial [Luteitalea sp.]|nr:glycine cleavage T C-terminal barrel domain-containing protein [Luteitalea sp.]